MTRVWRVVKERHAGVAFSGEGARRYGGRWNSRGVPMVYASESAALAALEILVHVEDNAALAGYVAYEVEVPDALVETLDDALLPRGWDAFPAPAATRALGDAWIASGRSLALRVPSAVVPGRNVLINSAHPRFRDLKVPQPKPFALDARLRR